MASILVVDDTPFWRDIAGEALRRSGFTVVTAGNGVEALAALRTHPVNLVILDVEMPQMQGLSFLQQLHQQAEWKNLPVIMLTGDMQKEHVILAKKLGAVEYLLKSRFSLPDLLSRVKHCLAAPAPAAKPPQIQAAPVQVQAEQPLKKTSSIATELPRLLTREQCITRAETALAGRNISMAAAQVISLATSPLTDVSELALRIGHDPVLSARVLQASTRASRATSRGVITTLPDAVKLLGCTTIRDIAASLGVFDAMPPASTDGFDPIRSWQHSLAVAKLCGQLAPAELSGTAYVVGLCHDLGEILFRTHFEDEYKRVLLAQTASGKPLHQVERTMLGLSHGQFSQTILRCMKIPDAIKLPIADYHDSILTGDHLREPLGRVLQLADLYATGMLMAPSFAR
jgi:DNA-binding response OmpR family regulator/HD-like signal output (HDOD) protein